MKNIYLKFSTAAMLASSVLVLAACGGVSKQFVSEGNAPILQGQLSAEQKQAQDRCDALRVVAKTDLLDAWQIGQVADVARNVSAHFTADEKQSLKSLIQVAEGMSQAELEKDKQNQAKADASTAVGKLLRTAVKRAGGRTGVGTNLEGDKLVYFFGFGFAASTYKIPKTFEIADIREREMYVIHQVGDISHISLMAVADQSKYYLQMVRVTDNTKAAGTNQPGETGEFITLADYADSKLPDYCKGVQSGIPENEFNSVSGI